MRCGVKTICCRKRMEGRKGRQNGTLARSTGSPRDHDLTSGETRGAESGRKWKVIFSYYYHTRCCMYTPHSTQGPNGAVRPLEPLGRQPLSILRPRKRNMNKDKNKNACYDAPREVPRNPSYQIQHDLQSWYPYPRLVVPGTGSRGNHATFKRMRREVR